MKKILLLSDTHSYIDDRMMHFASEADEIWHAGDWGNIAVHEKLASLGKMIRGVYGNIDGQDIQKTYPEHKRFECQGWDVWITHIGGYPGHYNPKLKNQIKFNPPGIFICGHSHILKVVRDTENKLLHLNPGAAGIHGFHKMRTMLRFKLGPGKIEGMEVIELGPRATILPEDYFEKLL